VPSPCQSAAVTITASFDTGPFLGPLEVSKTLRVKP
jgi:hypothetical protein